MCSSFINIPVFVHQRQLICSLLFFKILLSPLNCISLTAFSFCILIKRHDGTGSSLDGAEALAGLASLCSTTAFIISLSFWLFLVKLNTSSVLFHSIKFHHQWYYFFWIHFSYFNIQPYSWKSSLYFLIK